MGANMMLTIGSILIFGLFLSTSNKMMTGNSQIAAQNEYYVAGMSLAQSIIDEAKTKAYDEKTIDSIRTSPSSMTAVGSLGRESGEFVPATDTLTSQAPYSLTNKGFLSTVRFDDVDDYNGYKRRVDTPRAEKYSLTVSVAYASDTSPDSTKFTRTFCKRMTVNVTSPYFREIGQLNGKPIPDTLHLSYAFTY